MQEDSKKWIWWAVPAVVVLGLGAVLYYGRKHREVEPEPIAQAEPQPVSAEPPVKHPIDDSAADATQPLPTLSESDAAVQESLASLFGRTLDQYLVPQEIIRHTVVTIDNLPRKKTAVQLWPLKPTPGQLAVAGTETMTLGEANYARYKPLISLVQSADEKQLAAVYRRYYTLFQQAYVELGYPDGYFNDRLVEVIDHLLQTPEVTGPIQLTQPGVFYQFADPTLEERSAGQKLLIRMGPQNAGIVKSKLRQLRQVVAK